MLPSLKFWWLPSPLPAATGLVAHQQCALQRGQPARRPPGIAAASPSRCRRRRCPPAALLPPLQPASPTPIFGASATFGGTGFGGFSGVAAKAESGEAAEGGEGGDDEVGTGRQRVCTTAGG